MSLCGWGGCGAGIGGGLWTRRWVQHGRPACVTEKRRSTLTPSPAAPPPAAGSSTGLHTDYHDNL